MERPAAFSSRKISTQAIDDDGGETFGRLVEEQKFRAGDESSPDREHLLLAAG